MGGCMFPPNPPRVPPLPKGPTASPKLAAADVGIVQSIDSKAVYMKAIASLAATHSEDALIKGFASQLAQDYDKTHVAAQKIATNFNLTFADTSSPVEKARLATLGKLYGRPFDKVFLYDITHASTAKERATLVAVQKNGSIADVKSLATAAATLLEQCRTQGNGLYHR